MILLLGPLSMHYAQKQDPHMQLKDIKCERFVGGIATFVREDPTTGQKSRTAAYITRIENVRGDALTIEIGSPAIGTDAARRSKSLRWDMMPGGESDTRCFVEEDGGVTRSPSGGALELFSPAGKLTIYPKGFSSIHMPRAATEELKRLLSEQNEPAVA